MEKKKEKKGLYYMHRDFSLCVGGWVKEEEKGVKRK
jgi:hypothetical protein